MSASWLLGLVKRVPIAGVSSLEAKSEREPRREYEAGAMVVKAVEKVNTGARRKLVTCNHVYKLNTKCLRCAACSTTTWKTLVLREPSFGDLDSLPELCRFRIKQ